MVLNINKSIFYISEFSNSIDTRLLTLLQNSKQTCPLLKMFFNTRPFYKITYNIIKDYTHFGHSTVVMAMLWLG